MGLFKKNKKFAYSDYNYGRNQKSTNNKNAPTITSFDKIVYKVINENKDVLLYDVTDCILSGHPVLVKFEIPTEEANKMLAFLSGVVYTTDGKIFTIETRLFLIGRKEEFEDGSLYQYVEDLK